LVLWGACYYAALGLVLLVEFGATGPESIWASIQDPAIGYLNKFDIYQLQRDGRDAGLPMQLLMLLGVLGAALPLLVVYWKRLSLWLRVAGLTGIFVYASYFLFVGTLKGLGDSVVMLAGGLLIAAAGAQQRTQARRRRTATLIRAAALFTLFSLYMIYAQSARASQFGEADFVRPNPMVERFVGHDLASGVATTTFYPTHGYLGLAYNLQTPFTWSYGLGSSPTVAAYAEHFLGADLAQHPPYPVVTEARTGWPAGQYWATIYPWLASDLTFPGAVLFMGLVGWFFARFWTEAAFSRRTLSMLIFTQLCLLIAYIPANNQLGITPQSVIGMATLLALYAGTSLTHRVRHTTGPTSNPSAPADVPLRCGTTRRPLLTDVPRAP
jgi:hypothetical protein